MAMDAGNAGCTTGLSKRIYDQWTADPAAGFGTLSLAQQGMLKAQCWAVAKSVVDELVANSQVFHSGSPNGDTVR